MARLSTTAGIGINFLRNMSGNAIVLHLPERMPVDQVQAIANRLMTLPEVQYAVPDQIRQATFTPNDPSYSSQWHYYETYGINAPAAWDITTGSSSIVVAVIDTGITSHPDLNGRTVPGYDFIGDVLTANDGNGRDNDPSDPGDWITIAESESGYFVGCYPEDSSWHGTFVAGEIGAASNNGVGVAGVSWNSKILPVRVLGKCGGYDSDIIDGMRWAAGLSVSGVPANANPAKVLNLSLGGYGSCGTDYQTAINDINAAGASVVVSAGNDNMDASNISPANCNGVITVGATNRASGGRASYSNYGSTVEISAPGGDDFYSNDQIYSTINLGSHGPGTSSYGYMIGTSMSAPLVSGVTALMLSVNPSLTPNQVLQILQNTATYRMIVNAGAAVSAASNQPMNDNFNTPEVISTLPYSQSENTVGATKVPSDPQVGINAYNTVWYQFTLVSTGTASVTYTCANNPCMGSSHIYVWQGVPNYPYNLVTNKGFSFGDNSIHFTFSATAGQMYYLEIFSNSIGRDDFERIYGGGDINLNVILPAPGMFNKAGPANGAGAQPTNLTLNWAASNGAESYEYCYDTINNNACDDTWRSTATSTSVALTGLNYNTTYYWQVRSVNSDGETYADNNTSWSFTTQVLPPGAFAKSGPTSGSTGQPTSLTLSWASSSGATDYQYCYDTSDDDDCTDIWRDAFSDTTANVNVSSGTTYYWQVRANNAGGTTYADANPWWSFSTVTCHTLTGLGAPSGAGSITPNPLPDCESGAKFTEGTLVNLTASPASGYYLFDYWSGDVSGSDNPVQVTMYSDHSVTVQFVQSTFSDVPYDYSVSLGGVVYNLHDYIQALFDAGYTAGCLTNPLRYCPNQTMTRAESAVFMLRGQFGSGYTPPVAPWDTFADNWNPGTWAEKWAEGMWVEGMTAGCLTNPLRFCPWDQFPRVQAAVFGLRMMHGMLYNPPAASGTVFADMMDTGYYGTKWAEQAFLDGLLPACGTDTGSGKPLFCPNDLVTRAWGAYLIVQAKDLPLTP